MRVAGVIPARWGSTRLPGKSLQPLLGKPMVLWVVERVRRAQRLDTLLVATDDERIRDVLTDAGIAVVMTRPDHPSGTDRIAEAVAGRDLDIIVNIQGDEPLVDPSLIDRLVDAMVDNPAIAMATAAVPITTVDDLVNPAVVKVVCDARGRALYFSRAPIPHSRDRSRHVIPSRHLRHLGLYAYRSDFLSQFVAEPPCELEQIEKLEQLRALHMGAAIQVLVGRDAGVAVDTPDDVPAAEAALQAAGRMGDSMGESAT